MEKVWKKYGKQILTILRNLKNGRYQAVLHDNGLLYIPEELPVSTWMGEYADRKPVSPRTGFVVEINALWYNALLYLSGVADINNSKTLKKEKILKANISTRNFPIRAEAIKKKFKIQDGGSVYLFFTTDLNDNKIVIVTSKIK